MSVTRTAAAVMASAALVLSACSTAPSASTSGTPSASYRQAYATALDAYVYGLPLLTTDATFQTMTSVDVSQGAYGPVNQFNSVRSPNNAGSTAVVAPGATSLSSIAWLDLTAGPQVLHVPQVTGHFFVLALIDPYTENIVNLGTANGTPADDYVVATHAQKDAVIPAGAHLLEVDYTRIWVIGSTQLTGPDDVAAVNHIQDGYRITPLTGTSGTPSTASTPADASTTVTRHVPATGIGFFDQLGTLLAQFPPPAADSASLARFAAIGVGPGRTPSTDGALSADTRQALADAAAAGPAQVQDDVASLYAAGFTAHAGYLLGGFGHYGTDYAERAAISQIGLGAFVPSQAIYAMAWSDSTTTALTGASSYVLHLATAPPTTEGWSLTVYTLTGQLVASSAGRYAVTDTTSLSRNADGSVDLYLQPDAPTSPDKASNWLATPAGQGFEVTWRLLAPDHASVPDILEGSGWQPPAISRAR